jgi:ATP-dependent Clp protease ATP-binding subunit ClpA
MAKSEREREPQTRLSEEAINALTIARAIAPQGTNRYIKPIHIVVGLTKQPSIAERLLKNKINPEDVTGLLMGPVSLFESDCKAETRKDGDFSNRSRTSIEIAVRLAEEEGKEEVSAMSIAKGIIMEDQIRPGHVRRGPFYKEALGHTLKSILEPI